MYYIVFGLLYLLSMLPLVGLYRISDFAYFIMYRILRYRKDVVFSNLSIAFPEKTDKEKKQIAKQFYKNFTDTFIETIKLMSISERAYSKMVEMDLSSCIALANKGKSIQFHAGHQFNWELANWKIAKEMSIPFVGVYMKIHNKAINKIFYDLRSKKGTVLVSTTEFKSRMHELLKTQYSIGLAADQNPSNTANAYWLYFFSKPAPFVTGPDKAALKNNTAVVFVKMIKLSRGRYKFETEIIMEEAQALEPGALTVKYRNILEDTIRKNPSNYLWSHRRWKWEYHSGLEDKWVDTKTAPR